MASAVRAHGSSRVAVGVDASLVPLWAFLTDVVGHVRLTSGAHAPRAWRTSDVAFTMMRDGTPYQPPAIET